MEGQIFIQVMIVIDFDYVLYTFMYFMFVIGIYLLI